MCLDPDSTHVSRGRQNSVSLTKTHALSDSYLQFSLYAKKHQYPFLSKVINLHVYEEHCKKSVISKKLDSKNIYRFFRIPILDFKIFIFLKFKKIILKLVKAKLSGEEDLVEGQIPKLDTCKIT